MNKPKVTTAMAELFELPYSQVINYNECIIINTSNELAGCTRLLGKYPETFLKSMLKKIELSSGQEQQIIRRFNKHPHDFVTYLRRDG